MTIGKKLEYLLRSGQKKEDEMKFPEKCPSCGALMRSTSLYEPSANWIKIADYKSPPRFPKYETFEEKEEIWECSGCHSLFIVTWKFDNIAFLKNMPISSHDVEEFYKEEK